jgi:hypothetical protein
VSHLAGCVRGEFLDRDYLDVDLPCGLEVVHPYTLDGCDGIGLHLHFRFARSQHRLFERFLKTFLNGFGKLFAKLLGRGLRVLQVDRQ